jgi:PPM family protein phosphatase
VTVRFDIEFASQTDVGLRRSHNQDSHAALPAADADQWHERGHVFVVADGMGAHAVGELASKLAADSIPHIYSKHAHEGPVSALRRAFVEANLSIHNRGQANKEFLGMGTTGTALVLRPEGAWVGHVGDSRAYRVRNSVIEQLSFDHSLVWELARRQRKSPEELEGVPSNVIIRSLGPEALVQVDVEGPHRLEPGDAFVLCSDGLSGPVEDRDIGAIVSNLPPTEASALLIHLANLHGGPDNITAMVVRTKKGWDDGRAPRSEKNLAPAPARFIKSSAQMIGKLSSWLPWPFALLVLGIVLAVVAIYQTQQNVGGGIVVFMIAAVLVLVGLAGLVFHASRESKQSEAVPEKRPLRVYRQTSCAIELPMVQQQCKILASLEKRLRENDWAVDWNTYRQFLDKGRGAMENNQLRESYRQHALAMLMLLETLAAHRNREEAFKPLW